ncbi:dihydroneopterin aldolase [Candidatus Latescibacterota bacterium]
MNDSIRVIGLMFSARHGVLPEEKLLNQPFEVDVEVTTDLSVPAVSDNLDDTVNYSLIVSRVEEVMNGVNCNLIEKLAGLIIEKVSELIKSGEVIVRVRKPKAPLKIPFETVEVELKRTI